MEIDANMKWGSVSGLSAAQRPATGAPATAEGDSFASSNALESALASTPDVRSDAVANGRALVSDPGYPSDETIKKLSDFLAGQFQANPD